MKLREHQLKGGEHPEESNGVFDRPAVWIAGFQQKKKQFLEPLKIFPTIVGLRIYVRWSIDRWLSRLSWSILSIRRVELCPEEIGQAFLSKEISALVLKTM